MSSFLDKKIIIITGACGLLGRSFSLAAASHGATVIVSDIDASAALEFSNELLGKGFSASAMTLDITCSESVHTAISLLHKKYGRIDALVNNAYPRNKSYGNHFFDVEYKDFCENINVHLGGYFLCSKYFSKYFMDQGYGNIVSMASIYGAVAPDFNIYKGTDMTTPIEYALIKSAIIQLTKYMSSYLKGTGVRVNCVSPGGILDNQPDEFLSAYRNKCSNKGMLDVNDITPMLMFLLSDQSASVNGQNFIVDDGFSV